MARRSNRPLPFARRAAPLLLALAGLSSGCSTTATYVADRCDVNVLDVTPAEAAPGAEVTVVGGPLTRDWDTIVLVAGVSASIAGLDREGCSECDSCRSAASCNACDDCDDCDATCDALCVESVRFVLPELPPGRAELRLINAHGGSLAAELLVLEPAVDTGAAEDTASDSGGDTAAPPPPSAAAECR